MTYFGIDIGKYGAIVGTTAEKDPTWIFSEIPYQDGSLAITRLYFLLSKTIKRSDIVFRTTICESKNNMATGRV